jgi:hypothetical protein
MCQLANPQRIKQWYSNHTRGATTSETRGKVLVLQKKKARKLQPSQAYSRLFYEDKLKNIIAQRWAAHIAMQEDGDAKTKGPTLPFRNKVIKELYNAKSTEIKAEVENHRDVESESEPDDDDEDIDKEEARRRSKITAMQKQVLNSYK